MTLPSQAKKQDPDGALLMSYVSAWGGEALAL